MDTAMPSANGSENGNGNENENDGDGSSAKRKSAGVESGRELSLARAFSTRYRLVSAGDP